MGKVKDRLNRRAIDLSLEEQQKLCTAGLLPVKPKLLLMDEHCSALEPKGTAAVEELIWELRGQYAILIVTRNMAQARRASEECVFMLMGSKVEHAPTEELFVTPKSEETADYCMRCPLIATTPVLPPIRAVPRQGSAERGLSCPPGAGPAALRQEAGEDARTRGS